MSSIQVHVEGLEQLRQALRKLPADLQERELSKAVQAGALVIAGEAISRAPELQEPTRNRTPGLLKRMIRATRGVRNGSEATAFVSVRRLTAGVVRKFKQASGKSARDNPNDPFYWRFLEFGTSKMAAKPFLRPAFDAKKEVAVSRIKENLRQGIERSAQRVAGKKLW